MLLFLCYDVFFVSMTLLWLLLGAIINPNFFLIYTSSAATLITFITSKYSSLLDIFESGMDMIKDVLLKEFGKKVESIMG